MKDAGILDFFETTVFSNEVGWRKPDRRIFSVAIEKLNATPGRIIHVGDNPYADIWGAKKMGMRAFQFKYVCLKDLLRIQTHYLHSQGQAFLP